MSLYKRGNIYWAYYYLDGVRHQSSTGTGNKRQAQEILDKLKADANAARFKLVRVDPHLTFGELAAKFLAGGEVTQYHYDRLKQLLPYFAEHPVMRLSKVAVKDYRKRRTYTDKVSDATVNRDLSVLRHILYWALDEALIPEHPLGRMRLVPETPARRKVMSVLEEQRLLAVVPDHLRRILVCALDTGMRRGEITAQHWEDVELERGLLYVTKSKTRGGTAREIPLTRRLRELLNETSRSEGLVFLYQDQPVRIIKRSWKTALASAGLRYLRFHDVRHTFNTRLMEAGVLPDVRMALMGHSSGNKVHSTYTHVELPVKREAIARLEQWVQNQHESQGGIDADQTRKAARADPGEIRRSQTLEEENAGRDSSRTGRQT